jgi:hypothetical protein
MNASSPRVASGVSESGREPLASRIPHTHPKPYGSPLWPHLDTIRTLRRKHETWAAIASHLKESHGLEMTSATVLKFFKRAIKGRVPIGFTDPGASTVIAAASSSQLAGCPLNPEPNDDPLLIETSANDPFANLKRKYEQTRKIKQ